MIKLSQAQKNILEILYAGYKDILSEQGKSACQKFFGEIEVVEAKETSNVRGELEKALYKACYVGGANTTFTLSGFQYRITSSDVTTIKANALNSELPTGQARDKACKDMANDIVEFYKRKNVAA